MSFPMRQAALVVSFWGLFVLQSHAASEAVIPGERVSDWLLRVAPTSATADVVHWRVPAELGPQLRLKQAILATLEEGEGVFDTGLALTLQALPVTGRVLLASSDARWLQGTPQQDPVLAEGQSLLRYESGDVVAVLGGDGRVCLAEHGAAVSLQAYLNTCFARVGDIDWVWLVQPDGRVSKVGVAAWNDSVSAYLAPGAWVFAPRRDLLSESSADNIARFLATQAPPRVVYASEPVKKRDAATVSMTESAQRTPYQHTASAWGDIGLIQTPSARMESAGAVRASISRAYPYTNVNVLLQPLDAFELGFRYTDIANALYGPNIAGDQTYKDKSIDVKLRVLQEDAFLPQVALGIRDVGGTGLFASEYVVANKRWGAWDASLGLGWGYMGGRGGVAAPLGFLGEGFRSRPSVVIGSGGETNAQSYFRGDAAVLGGVQWTSSSGKWVLKAELDGNNYQKEPLGTTQPQDSPVNVGVVYRYSPHVDWSASVERGNRFGLGLTLHFDLSRIEMPKPLDPVPPRAPLPVAARPVALQEAALAADVRLHTGWAVQYVLQTGSKLLISAEATEALFLRERVERALLILDKWAPTTVRHFVLDLQQRGLPLTRVEVNRAEWQMDLSQAQAPSLKLPPLEVYASPPQVEQGAPDADVEGALPSDSKPLLQFAPSYSQILGGPDGFILYQAGVQARFEYSFQAATWISGNLNARLLDNYGGFKYDAPSELPRVRTQVREYVTTSQLTLPVFQLSHVADLGGGHYASAYGGYLESMYAGVGGEWLYRPWKGPLAFGIDVNRVRQRSFAQDLGLRDYEVDTGHATAYWDTGFSDIQVKLQMGRYLAGDVGATLDVRRVFANGTTIGAWATKTNVSAAQFGEGSFDKGIYVSMPFDLLLPKSSAATGSAVWTPLLRDGGARLSRSVTLFDLTAQRDPRAMSFISNPTSRSANRFVTGVDLSRINAEPSNRWLTGKRDVSGAAYSLGDVPYSTWMWGAGIVLAASAFDSQVDKWAVNHQGAQADRFAKIGNAIPFAMTAASGVLLTGLAGDGAANTAQTALLSAGVAVGANLGLKYVVGRARPIDGQGTNVFQGAAAGKADSSFASNHVTAAFALVTPFAQQYDMPSLYWLAAASGVGRIQQREHWLSDTVAGGLLGYAVGSLLSNQQLHREKGWRLDLTPSRIGAIKSF